MSGKISEGNQNSNVQEHKHYYVHCSFIYNCQDMEVVQVSIIRGVDKTTKGHLHSGILPEYKTEEILHFGLV